MLSLLKACKSQFMLLELEVFPYIAVEIKILLSIVSSRLSIFLQPIISQGNEDCSKIEPSLV